MTRPCRRSTRHLLQILFTLGLTFTVSCPTSTRVDGGCWLLVAVDDPPAGQVVGRKLHHDPILGQDADVVLPHLAADVGQHPVAVGELDPEHRVRKRLHHSALDLDGPVLLRHILHYLTYVSSTGRRTHGPWAPGNPPAATWTG